MRWLQQVRRQSRLLLAEMVDTVRQALTLDQRSADGAELMSLEDRILYSAAPMAVDVAQLHLDGEQAHIAECVDTDVLATVDGTTTRDTEDMLGLLDQVSCLVEQEFASEQGFGQTYEIAFVDRSLENIDVLLEDLRTSRGEQVHFEVRFIDTDVDGISFIGQVLSQSEHDFQSVHLITHGVEGAFQLGIPGSTQKASRRDLRN